MQRPPRAFVSHTSVDKERFVIAFAEKLRQHGIDAWLDQWEIRPGDSLVDKVFSEGIARADAVIVVLSENSVAKPWVRAELSVSIVRRIEEQMRLIPVILDDIDRPRIPESLRDVLWIKIPDLENYDEQLDSIVKAIYGVYDKPPLGPTPSYAIANTTGTSELSRLDSLVLRIACERAIERDSITVHLSGISEQAHAFGISDEKLQEVLEMLNDMGYIAATEVSANFTTFIAFFKILAAGFESYARENLAEYPMLERRVASLMVNDGIISSNTIAEALQQPHLVIQFVLDALEVQGHIKLVKLEQGWAKVVDIRPSLRRWLRNS